MAECHPAEHHLLVGKREEGRGRLVPEGPGLDAAADEPVGAREQHHGLHIHAEVGPLRRPHAAIHRNDQSDGSAEEFEIAGILAIARRTVLAGNAEGAVEQRADLEAAGVVGSLSGDG